MKPAFEDEVEAVEEWLGYVERTYIGVINGRTGNRKAPMFSHSLWNKYTVKMEDEALTSNSAEGFNAALALSMPRNCSILTLIKQLQSEENTNIRKLMDVALGHQNHSCRIFVWRREPTSLRWRQDDQNTLKFNQKHNFYATILARQHQTLKSGEPKSPDPGVSTGVSYATRNHCLGVTDSSYFTSLSWGLKIMAGILVETPGSGDLCS